MDPEGLREQNHLLQEMLEQQKAYIEIQEKRIAEKDAAIADLKKLVDELQALKANLLETLAELRRQFFGAASEKTESPKPSEEAGEDSAKTIVRAHSRGARKPKATRAEQYAALPVREIQIPLTQEERRCPYCNGGMETVSYVKVREELRITPAKVERIRYLQETAVCPECRKDGDGTFAKASVPMALMPHSPASASAVAYVMFQRVFLGLPYYRQESLAAQLGLTLPRETMANWCIYCAEHYLLPLYEKLHSLLLERDVLHADETTCQVLHEKGRPAESTSYMWIFLTGSDGLAPIVLYDYQPSRRGACARDFLEGFHGLLQCDGYQGYNKVEDVVLVCCLAHCRRKFFEAVPIQRRKNIKLLDILSEEAIPEPRLPKEGEIPTWIPAEVGLSYCNRLFYIERGLKDLPAQERALKRRELEVPVWEGFFQWAGTVDAAGGSKLAKAVKYALDHRDTLNNYLLDGRCEISNNAAEQSIRGFCIGKKNWVMIDTIAGAKSSAIIYSIAETAKANNLKPYDYFEFLLTEIPKHLDDTDRGFLDDLLPWSPGLPANCRKPNKSEVK